MIHIHAQQNDEKVNGVKTYYYNPTTKDEKGISKGGRKFPITADIRKILSELKAKQEALGIEAEWVFAREEAYIVSIGEMIDKFNNQQAVNM